MRLSPTLHPELRGSAPIPYEDLTPEPIELPPRQDEWSYVRPPMSDQTFIPEIY